MSYLKGVHICQLEKLYFYVLFLDFSTKSVQNKSSLYIHTKIFLEQCFITHSIRIGLFMIFTSKVIDQKRQRQDKKAICFNNCPDLTYTVRIICHSVK